jgi:hypothetical protein
MSVMEHKKNLSFFVLRPAAEEVPATVGSGLLRGVQGFGFSMLSAVAGLVDQPMQSVLSAPASASRARVLAGVAAGVGRGMLGVLVKPLGDAMELVHSTSQGLLGSAGLLPHQRNRDGAADTTASAGLPSGRLRRGSRGSGAHLLAATVQLPALLDEDTAITLFPQRVCGPDLGLAFVVAEIFAQPSATVPATEIAPRRWLVLTPTQLSIVTCDKVLERFVLAEITALAVSNAEDLLALVSITVHAGSSWPSWPMRPIAARRVAGYFRRWKTD